MCKKKQNFQTETYILSNKILKNLQILQNNTLFVVKFLQINFCFTKKYLFYKKNT